MAREPLLDAQGRAQRDARGRKQFGPETVIRGDDGSPIVRAEPILSREVFDRLGVELAERENRKEPTVRSSGLLLQVVFCGVCGRPAYRLKGGKGRNPRYRCASAQYKNPCGNRSIPMADADETVETILLNTLGESERLERIWATGSDHSAELAETDAVLADLTDQLGAGAFTRGTPQRARLDARIKSLAARRDELASQAVTPAGWEWEPTGELFVDWWSRQGVTARNVWLRSMGVRLTFTYAAEHASPSLNLEMGGLSQMTEGLSARGNAATLQSLFADMTEAGTAGIELETGGRVTIHTAAGEVHSFTASPNDGSLRPIASA